MKEKQYLQDLQCEKLRYLKHEREDKKYLKSLDCEKIRNIALRKRCEFEELCNKAIKKYDESFCGRLPRIKQKECYKIIHR